ncbi:MAG: serine/threonine-protein phosphatase, partial [Planctomycetes bacterium]|nr:serine/threonine-protein phosphatase [Planctomycetota bacterium]
ILHYEAQTTEDVAQIAAAMNRKFMEVAGPGDFVTCFLARLRPEGSIEYVRAGHDPGVIVRGTGSAELLADGGAPIGIATGDAYLTSRATLNSGDRLFLYTDGLHEAASDTALSFGREQLADLLVETSGVSPAEQLDDVIKTVASFAGDRGFDDDVTLLCVWRRTPASIE